MCTFLTRVDKVTAGFEVDSKENFAGTPVKFHNSSHFGRGKAYWNFGDGTPVYKNHMPDIEHTFENPGEYEISLKVTFGKSSDEIKKRIRVEKRRHD